VFSRKPKADADKLRAYELAVNRCYPRPPDEKRPKLELEFFRLSCCNRFNSKKVLTFSGERDYLRECSFQLYGIVGGWIGESAQVPVQLEVVPQVPRAGEVEIGGYSLTHRGFTATEGDKLKACKRPMQLDITLYDPEKLYESALRDAMRDAAISGQRFLHVELRELTIDPEETKSPLDLMIERGYGPYCGFKEVALWPEITLRNAPSWATNVHNF
jgi:hypothetical protein